MTPDNARDLLYGTTPGPWEPHPDYPTMLVNLSRKMAVAAIPGKPEDCTPEDEENLSLIAAAPTLAALRAEMNEEWGVRWPADEYGTPKTTWGMPDREYAEDYARYLRSDPHCLFDGVNPSVIRVVRRYVTPTEEM